MRAAIRVVEHDGQRRDDVGEVALIARADDRPGNTGLVEDPSDRDGANRHPLLRCGNVQGVEQRLQVVPPAAFVDDQPVFDERAILERLGWRGLAAPLLGKEPARQRAIGKQRDSVRGTERSHFSSRPSIEQRVLQLVRPYRDAACRPGRARAADRSW